MLPRNASYVSRVPMGDVGEYGVDREVDIWAFVRNDPRFGFKFVKSFCDLHRSLPVEVNDDALWRLYCFKQEKKTSRDFNILEACTLTNPRMKVVRTLIECLLIHPGFTFKKISKLSGYPVDVISLFHELFFNVRNRIDDPELSDEPFILSLVYPESRQVQLYRDYHLNESWVQVARRVTYDFGLSVLFQWLGGRTMDSEVNGVESMRAVESRIASTGRFAFNCGFQHQFGAVAINNARQLLQSTKAAGADSADDDSTMGLTRLSMDQGAMAVFKRIVTAASEERMRNAQMYDASVASQMKSAKAAIDNPKT